MTSFPLNLENCLLKLKTKHKVRLLSILHSTYFCKPLKVQSTESPCITCMKGPEKKIALCENHTMRGVPTGQRHKFTKNCLGARNIYMC